MTSVVVAGAAWLMPAAGFGGLGTMLALLLFAAVIALAVVPPPQASANRFGVLEYLPVAFVFAILAITTVGLISSWSTLDVWSGRLPATVTWTALLAAPTLAAAARGGDVRISSWRGSAPLLGASLAFVWAPMVLLPLEQWARSVTPGTDFSRHVAIVQNVGDVGGLSYSADAYPRSAHASIALLQRASGDLADYASTWQATQASLVTMIGLMAFAAAILAARSATAMRLPAWLASAVAPVSALALTLTGLWIGSVLPSGYVTTVQAGLIIGSAAMLIWDGDQLEAPRISIGLLALSVALAHSWLLLVPLVAAPAGLLIISASRRGALHRGLVFASCAASVGVVAPIVIASITHIGLSAVGLAGGTAVPRPGIQWLALMVFAAFAAVLLSRADQHGRSSALMLMIVCLLFLELFLLTIRQVLGGDWYYVIKTAWTPLALLLGLAIPSVLWLGSAVWRRLTPEGGRRPVAATTLVVACAAALAALNWTASPLTTVASLWGSGNQPALAIPLMERFLELPESERRSNYIVWGLSPQLDLTETSIHHAGFADFSAVGTLYFAGYPAADLSAAYPAMVHHDPVAFCDYLRDNPSTGRITGPRPSQSLGWLLDAGCPAEVVRPAEWLSIEVGPEWFMETPGQQTPIGEDYPTWDQAEELIAEIRAK